MKICKQCNKPINKGQKIAVYSYPLECLDYEGGYAIIEDFLEKEICLHARCFNEILNNSAEKIQPIVYEQKDVYNKSKEIRKILLDLGEKLSDKEVKDLTIKCSHLHSIDDIITWWFKNRNKLSI